MTAYAVTWRREGDPPRLGKLELGDAVARFSARGAESLAIARDDVVDVRIARTDPAARGAPTLVVRCRDGVSVRVGSVFGFGVLHEIADSLAPPAPRAA